MADSNLPTRTPSRDGTSQTGRRLPELDGNFALIDERTTRDLLAFARQLALGLKYFDLDDRERGDWRGLLGNGAYHADNAVVSAYLDAAARYAAEPEAFSREKAAPFARPHFALLLAFLELLGVARTQINTLTQRHLAFYYDEVLRMSRNRAIPDRVHLLVELDGRTPERVLPAGTALDAGKDSNGQPLRYLVDSEWVVNGAQVASIRTLRADLRTIGIREASPPHHKEGTRPDAFLAMFRIALGQPSPGDPLPVDLGEKPPRYPGVPPAGVAQPKVDFDVLVQTWRLIMVVESGLGMPSFDDFRRFVELVDQRRPKLENDEWDRINAILRHAVARRDAAFPVDQIDGPRFDTNLQVTLNKPLDRLFDGLSQVDTLEQAYAALTDGPEEAREFLTRALAPLTLDEFRDIMQIKMRMDDQWEEINQRVEEAARQKRGVPEYVLPPDARAARNVKQKMQAADLVLRAGADYKFSGELNDYWEAFRSVERYFFMSAESFKYVMSLAPGLAQAGASNPLAWKRAFDILEAAHAESVFSARRAALKRMAGDRVENLPALLAEATGETLAPQDAVARLAAYGIAENHRAHLLAAIARTATPDWPLIYDVLGTAQRNRLGITVPPAQRHEWRHLYPAIDATRVRAHPDDARNTSFKAFGRERREPVADPHALANIGWALSSPLLTLDEGKRIINLTLGFDGSAANFSLEPLRALLALSADARVEAAFNPFLVEVSTAKGWLKIQETTLSAVDANLTHPPVAGRATSGLRALKLRCVLGPDQPGLTAAESALHGLETQAPALRLMLAPEWSEADQCLVTGYQVLRPLRLMRLGLEVECTGLTQLHLTNDQGVLDPKKPFNPFDTQPAVGSRLTIGHREIARKNLDSLSFEITWMGAPANFATHYANYPGALNNTNFSASVLLIDSGVTRPFTGALTLFDSATTQTRTVTLPPPSDQGDPSRADTHAADVSEWNRHIVWELASPDFQHSTYPGLALEKSVEMAAAVANAINTKATVESGKYKINPPYTPRIKSLRLNYKASAEVIPGTAANAGGALLFHIEPFGYRELRADDDHGGGTFLPRFDFAGELYIGLRGVTAPQHVSVLFQMADGSARSDGDADPVKWSYLSGNQWRTLQEGGVISDATRGLINSGIAVFDLKPAQPNTLLPGDLYWLRAAIARTPDSVCDMIAIHANAIAATFVDDGNAPDHLARPLQPEVIKGFESPVPGIARLRQPYPSFGGKMPEQDSRFHVRVSEHLRHKRRALTPWDYERLVLEHFPGLYKVKCLRADADDQQAPVGTVRLVVIPDVRDQREANPFEPKASADVIRDVRTFLQDKVSPFVDVQVGNAQYVALKVRCGVRFVEGADAGACRWRLNEELNRFLSPWAYDEAADLIIGGSVYANSVIEFIDRRDYVDYVAEFKLFTSEDGENFDFVPVTEAYHASARSLDGVLVSAREHQFDEISDVNYRVEDFSGINYMKIELDFVVG